MEPDRSWYTLDDEIVGVQPDPRFYPSPPPASPPFVGKQSTLCVSDEWWPHIAGILNRLQYSDAWDSDDEEEVALTIQYVTQIIDAINQRATCMSPIQLQTECGCTIINYTEQVNYYNRYQIENVSIEDNSVVNYITALLDEPTIEAQEEEVEKFIQGDPPTSDKICQAVTMLFYWLHDIGVAAEAGRIQYGTPVPLIDKISEWAQTALAVGNLLIKVFPASAAVTATIGVATQISWIADDLGHFAAAILTTDFTEQEILDFICYLHEAMDQPGAGYTNFVNVSYFNQDMDDIWASIVSPDLYGAFLALLNDPTIDYEFYCCTDCVETWAGYEEVLNGIPHHLYPEIIMLPATPHTGGTITRKIQVKVNYENPGRLRYVRFACNGHSYINPYTGTVKARIYTDQHPATQVLVYETGLEAERADLEQNNQYIAPPSIVSGAQPVTNYFVISLEYALCSACTTSSLDAFDRAWCYLKEIRYCVE